MTDFLDQKRTEITARLRELEPLVKEFKRLQDAAAALTAVSGSSPAPAPRASTPTAAGRSRASRRPPKSTAASATLAATPAKGRRGGRPKGSGTRAAQALSLVQGQPGITIPELAAKMKIKQNYLYRVLPGLEQEGKITKRGRGWHPKS